MTTTYEMTSVTEAVDVGTSLTQSWFRGHTRMVGELIPRIHRPQFAGPMIVDALPDLERRFIEEFKRDARPLAHHDVPEDDDLLGWLYIMQHYEAPTRLLDWTENILAALFFAVSGDKEEDGELWAMLPWALNKEAGAGYGEPLYDRSAAVEFLVREPYSFDPDQLAEEIAEKHEQEPTVYRRPIAFKPRRDFTRMVVQSSTFTIHPEPSSGNRISEVLADPKHLVRYKIPAWSKRRIQKDLVSLGIYDPTLFPDFEGIAKGLTRGGIDIAYSPPDPPECSGTVRHEEEHQGE